MPKPAPDPRRVAAAPRAPVTTTPLAKSTPAPSKAKSPPKQVASIPRLGPVASGSTRRVLFAPGSARLEADGQAILGPIWTALAKNPRLRVELKAYARGNSRTISQARRLSLSRALAIRSHLIKRGVKATRIDVRALGSKVTDGVPNRVDLLVFTR
jgi:outer membrane protein OmpA-like peptidoglycan-associated protein